MMADRETGTAATRLEGRRVLLVEDETLIAMELESALEAAGAVIVGPIGGLEAAIAAAREEAVDVAILDVDLAGRDVYPAAEALQARGIPFVFHTGHGTGRALSEAFPDAPACEKPCTGEALLAVVERALI